MNSRLHWTREDWHAYLTQPDQAFEVRCYAQRARISEAKALEHMIDTAIANQRLLQHRHVTAPTYSRRQWYAAQDYRILTGRKV